MKIKEKIDNLISQKEIKMKSKSLFVLKKISIFSIIISTSLLAFFLLSFISFKLRINGLWMFSKLGIGKFLYHLPWGMILVVTGLIIIVELFIKRFSYKKPLIYSLVIVLIMVFMGGFIIDRAGIHDRMQEKGIYRHGIQDNVYKGVIENYKDNEFDLTSFRVRVTPDTKIIRILRLENGMEVMVIGEEIDEMIEAQLISTKPHFRRMK